MKKFLAILVLGLLWCNHSFAELTAKTYLSVKESGGEDWQYLKVYIRGVTKGYFWYNSIVGSQKGEKLYCQSMNLLLKENDYLDLIDKEIKYAKKKGFYDDNDDVEMLLGVSLKREFPCK